MCRWCGGGDFICAPVLSGVVAAPACRLGQDGVACASGTKWDEVRCCAVTPAKKAEAVASTAGVGRSCDEFETVNVQQRLDTVVGLSLNGAGVS